MPDFVDAREIFEKVKREAQAESDDQHFLPFPPFAMDPKKGLFVTVGREPRNDPL